MNGGNPAVADGGIKAIAKALDLSPSTVSRALNGVPGVREGTRKLVEETARAMGYVPNLGAQQLVGKRSNLIGVYVPEFDHGNSLFTDMFASIQKALQSHGKDAIFYYVPYAKYEGQRLVESVHARNLEGCILLPAFGESHPLTQEALRIGVPCVNFEGVVGPRCSAAMSDDAEGGRIAARRLLEAGHRVIGFIGGPMQVRVCGERYAGFKEALAEGGVGLPDELTAFGDFSVESGTSAARRLLEARPDLTALFSVNDLMATGAITELRKAGIRVPEDVSVIGYDDDSHGPFLLPPLTTIRHGKPKVLPLLIELLEGKSGRIEIEKPQLIERQSVAAGPARQ